MRAFLLGIEKRDERFIVQAMRTIEFEPGERVIRKDTVDKSVLFVAGGSLICFSFDGLENDRVYQEGSILGIEQFLFDKPWEADLLCDKQATVCKLKYENMLNLISTNALAASRLYKRIMRHYCYMQIYEKKRANMNLFNFSKVDDDDLFIDFKLDLNMKTRSAYQKPAGATNDHALFSLLHQARLPEQRGADVQDVHLGREHETMPYFLTDQFRQILEASQEQKKSAIVAKLGERAGPKKADDGDQAPVGLYKSLFLRQKIENQNERRKKDRAATGKAGAGSPRSL